MLSPNYLRRTLMLLALAAIVSGCSGPESKDKDPVKVSGSPPATGKKHNHDEDHKGPHDGHVLELGRNHEYHAELVENEAAGTMTVYILDKDMKELAIDQKAIVMNLVVKGQAKAFELTATGATNGKSSRFDAPDKGLVEALDTHGTSGKLRVMINGAPHTAEVEHEHDKDE